MTTADWGFHHLLGDKKTGHVESHFSSGAFNMSAVKSPVPSSAPAKQQDESLWLKLLQQNSARTVTPNSTVLVIGGNTYQRKDILRNLAQSSAAGDDDSLGELELVNSAFFEVEDAVFDTPVKVNMWGFHDKLIPHVSQIVKAAESQKVNNLLVQ